MEYLKTLEPIHGKNGHSVQPLIVRVSCQMFEGLAKPPTFTKGPNFTPPNMI
jgi:hypothetical protein